MDEQTVEEPKNYNGSTKKNPLNPRKVRGFIKSNELELIIEGILVSIRVRGSRLYCHIKLKEIVSSDCANLLQLLKHYSKFKDVDVPATDFVDANILLLKLPTTQCLETIYRVIHIMEWEGINKLFINIVNNIRDSMKDKINRLKVLEGSIEAGHTNPEVLEELLTLYNALNRLKLLPQSHASRMSKQYSNMFLQNVKKDDEAHKLSKLT